MSELTALTDSLIDGVYPVGMPEPPGDLQRAHHALELAQVLLARHEQLGIAESYAQRALTYAGLVYAPQLHAECIKALVSIRVDSARKASAAQEEIQDAPGSTAGRRTWWDYLRDSLEMVGALATALAVVWAVLRHFRGRDDRRVARYETNQRAAAAFLGVHMASFQGVASEVVGNLFRANAPVIEEVANIVYQTDNADNLPDRYAAIELREPDVLQWVRFGSGSRAWRARDTWGQAFKQRVARVRLDSVLADQVLLIAGALTARAYRQQFNDRQLSRWLIELARELVERQATPQRMSLTQIKAQWSLLLVQRIITLGDGVTFAEAFNLFEQIITRIEGGFERLTQKEKVARLAEERSTVLPPGPMYAQLEAIAKARIKDGTLLAQCIERIEKLKAVLGAGQPSQAA